MHKDEWAFNYWVLDKLFYEDEELIEEKIIDYHDLGAVCWRNEEWIYEFSLVNRSIIQSIIDTSFAFCHSEINMSDPREIVKVRDIMEALLGITRLKKENTMVAEIMNCNSKKVKDFIVDLKKINEMITVNNLRKHFISRIELKVPDNMRNVSPVVYPLIEVLSDGNAVKLTGFTETDE